MKFGIDVSKHNGVINWAKVAANKPHVDFAILKTTEGATLLDKKFYTNVKGCFENGIKWTGYHFATWNNENEELDAAQEARFFISIIKSAGHPPSLPLILDIETNDPIPYTHEEMVAYVNRFVHEVQAAGYEIGIYASPGFLNSYFPKNHPFTNLKWWAADYTGAINPVPGWTKAWLHQYTEKGEVQGITGNVDLNRIVE